MEAQGNEPKNEAAAAAGRERVEASRFPNMTVMT